MFVATHTESPSNPSGPANPSGTEKPAGRPRGEFSAGTSEALDEVLEAVGQLGLSAEFDTSGLIIDGTQVNLPVVERAHPHPAIIADLISARVGPGLLIADRISEAGRQVLRDSGWSWLDRRGHLRLWIPGLRVDAPIGLGGDNARGNTGSPWTPVGLELALHSLIHPDAPVTARSVAPVIGRSAGGTQQMLSRFTEHGLIGPTSKLPVLPELFWETAARWPDDDWVPIALDVKEIELMVGGEPPIRVDERAATLGGARIPAAGDMPARCYVSKAQLRRLNQHRDPEHPATWVREAPVKWVPLLEEFEPDDEHPWRIAHPILCAVRLGADRARGRELVESWGVVPE